MLSWRDRFGILPSFRQPHQQHTFSIRFSIFREYFAARYGIDRRML